MKSKSISHRMAGTFPAVLFVGFVALALCAFASDLRADDADNVGQPARAIRLAYVDGHVQLARGGQVIAQQAVANTPLMQGMTLTTADDGRAEIQFEDGSVARLSPNSSLTLQVLSGTGSSADAEMDLERGLGYFELQGNGQAGQMRVRFGDAAVTASGFTVLRVRNDTPPGEVAVFSGNAHIERGPSLSLDLHSGESVNFTPSDPSNYILAESIEPDSWDTWNSDRDQALSAAASSQTSAPQSAAGGNAANPAWNDLDASGSWYSVPDQGYVWSPYEASNPGFDPYGNGNWVWEPSFGYVWASGYPWGYMPFQCGAWNYYDAFGWGWAPGFGGCNPWWNMGFYGGPFIGFAPGWYRPILRPRGPHSFPPSGPHGPGPRPIPVIAVHRGTPSMHDSALPSRDRNVAVNINGHTLQALRPMPFRTNDDRAAFLHHQAGNGYALGQPGGNRQVYSMPRSDYTSRQGFNGSQQPGNAVVTQPGRTFTPYPNRGNQPVPGSTRTYTPPAPPARTSGGGSHPSGGNSGGSAAPHAASGGGGYHGGGATTSGAAGGGGGHR